MDANKVQLFDNKDDPAMSDNSSQLSNLQADTLLDMAGSQARGSNPGESKPYQTPGIKKIYYKSLGISVFLLIPMAIFIIWKLNIFNQPEESLGVKRLSIPEDNIIQDSPPQDIDQIENIKIEHSHQYVLIIPQYKSESEVTLKIINFNDEHNLRLKFKINGVSQELQLASDYETHVIEIPGQRFRKRNLARSTKIPRYIFQTYERRNVTRKKYLSVRSIIDFNPNYHYFFFDSQDRIKFLKEHYNEYVLNAYLKLIPGTYKSDFFRHSFLYIYGGIYMDCKEVCEQNFENLITSGDDMIFAQDNVGKRFYQTAFLAGVPGIEPFKTMIDLLIENIYTRYYGNRSLDPTGPGALYRAVSPYVYDKNSEFRIRIIEYVDPEEKLYNHEYRDKELGRLAYFTYPGYYNENNYAHTNYPKFHDMRWLYKK